ncbi:MAG: YbaN family protein [Bacteroidales bacterium]|jgi:uncharacterized membrane protein YbaN (DUF454 family)
MIRYIFILLGTASLGFGIVGIIVPGVPTTPFLLLSAGLYLRGSDRLYRKLMRNRLLGPYISRFRNDKGLTIKTKITALLLMWCMILLSVFFFINNPDIDLVLFIAGVIGIIVMGFVLPTISRENKINR